MLMQLRDALGVAREMAAVSNQATRSVQEWPRDHLAPHAAPTGQICLALAKAMSDAGRYMAEGAKKYYGLSTTQIRYFTVGMTSTDDSDPDQHAA